MFFFARVPPGISDCPVSIPWLSRCIPWCQLFHTVEFCGGSLLARPSACAGSCYGVLGGSRTGHGHPSLVLAALLTKAVGFAALGPHLAAMAELTLFPGSEIHGEQGPACLCNWEAEITFFPSPVFDLQIHLLLFLFPPPFAFCLQFRAVWDTLSVCTIT